MPVVIKTVISLTILHVADSDDDRHRVERMSLAQMGHFIDEGDGLGRFVTESIEEIAADEVEGLAQTLGNDGAFFQQDVADIYFPPSLRSEDEAAQHWTVKADQEADALFRTLSDAEIRNRQDICKAQATLAYEQGHARAALDIARNEEALMREMLRRC